MLNVHVDDIESVDENLRSLYVEKDGAWKLNADYEDVAPLKNALQRQKDKVAKANEQLSKLSPYSALTETEMDVDDILEMINNPPKPGGDIDLEAERTRWDAKHEKDKQKLRDSYSELEINNQKLEKKLKNNLVENQQRSAALAAGVIPEDVDDVLRLTRHNFDADEDGKVIVLDEDGDPSGMTSKEWYENVYKASKPKFFLGTQATGSGAKTSAGKAGADLSNMTATQKIAQGLANK